MITDVLKNFAVWIDGYGYAGKASSVELPKLTIHSEDYRAGGMDAPEEIDLGMEKLESVVTLEAFDAAAQSQFGLAAGMLVYMTIKGALTSEDGIVTAVEATLAGIIKEVDPGNWQPGTKAQLKLTLAVRFYELLQAGSEVYYIDIENFIRRIGGFDQLVAIRAALTL